MSERLTAFLKTVTDFADSQCSDIAYKAQSFKDENIFSYQKEAEKKHKDYIEYEIGKNLTTVNKTISDYEAEKKSALISLRSSITDKVFTEVKERIAEFTKSENYVSFLLKSAEMLKKAIGENATVLMRGEDMKYAEKIKAAANCQVKEDNAIILGGLRAVNSDETVIIDDSLEHRLDKEYKDFIKKSSLKIF